MPSKSQQPHGPCSTTSPQGLPQRGGRLLRVAGTHYCKIILILPRASHAHAGCGAGGMAGGFFATNLGATSVAGVEGWRCAFHFIAALSVVTAVLVAWLAVDPRLSLRVRTGFAFGPGHFSTLEMLICLEETMNDKTSCQQPDPSNVSLFCYHPCAAPLPNASQSMQPAWGQNVC